MSYFSKAFRAFLFLPSSLSSAIPNETPFNTTHLPFLMRWGWRGQSERKIHSHSWTCTTATDSCLNDKSSREPSQPASQPALPGRQLSGDAVPSILFANKRLLCRKPSALKSYGKGSARLPRKPSGPRTGGTSEPGVLPEGGSLWTWPSGAPHSREGS